MAPGQRLVEEELAGMLGVTRASLRAALFDLAARDWSSGYRTAAPGSGPSPWTKRSRSPSAGWRSRDCARPSGRTGHRARRGPAAPAGRRYGAQRLGRRAAEVLGAQSRAAPAGAGDLRPGGGGQPARAAERPAGPPPVPAVAAPRAPAGLAPRAPGDHRRRGRAPSGRGRGRHPPPPAQRHHGAARPATGSSTSQEEAR